MKPSELFIGVALFLLVIGAGMGMMGVFREEIVGFGTDEKLEQFNDTFNQLESFEARANALEASVSGLTASNSAFDVLNNLLNGAWNTLRLMGSTITTMYSVVAGGLATLFGLPEWVIGWTVAVISVMVSFAVFGAIFQRDL